MKHLLTRTSHVGFYYRDQDGEVWATCSGPARPCADCGASHDRGYSRGMQGSETNHCGCAVVVVDNAAKPPTDAMGASPSWEEASSDLSSEHDSSATRPDPTRDDAHQLMPRWLAANVPALYATEGDPDPTIHAKYFTPDAGWTWYVAEFDPQEELCFGFVRGLDDELGYFSLTELRGLRGPLGLAIERDLWWHPVPLSVVQNGRVR